MSLEESLKRQYEISEKIIEVLTAEKCTISEATTILKYVENVIEYTSVVQSASDYLNELKELL